MKASGQQEVPKSTGRTARSLRQITIAALCLLAVPAFVGCERDADPGATDEPGQETEQAGERSSERSDEKEKPYRIENKDGPTPTPETTLVETDDIHITLADYDRFMRRSLFFAPSRGGQVPDEVPIERLANPRTQTTTLRSLLAAELVEREVARRDIEPTRDEKVDYIKQHDKLARFLRHLDGVEAETVEATGTEQKPLPEGLSGEDLLAVADRQVAREKLRDALLQEIDREKLWEIYKRRHDTIRLALASKLNTPSAGAIEDFLDRDRRLHVSPIRRHFHENRDKYRQPKLVELTTLAPAPSAKGPSGGAEGLEKRLQKAARRLADGESAQTIADELNLQLETDQLLVRKENREAFSQEKGETGYQLDGPRGAYAWRVEGWQESQKAKLTSGIRREIASELLREKVVPSVRDTLYKMIQTMKEIEAGPSRAGLPEEVREKLRERADALDVELTITEPFPDTENGDIPEIGLAKPVVEKAFSLPENRYVSPSPILSRGTAYVFRIIARESPSRTTFQANLASFRDTIRNERKNRMIYDFVGRWMDEHDPTMDLDPLQIKYGILRKK